MFHRYVHILALNLILGALSAISAPLLQRPETVVYDVSHNRYLISNWTGGDILALDRFGSYTVFFSGLKSAAGLHILGDSLFVGSNFSSTLQGVAVINLNTAELVSMIHPAGMTFANDIATDTSGYLYVSDTETNRIFKVNLRDGTSSTLTASIQWPNGVHFDHRNNRLLVASNTGGAVRAVDTHTGAVTPATTFTGAFDGFAEDRLHNLYASISDDGNVYRFDSTLQGTPAAITIGHNVPEGIDFNVLHSTLGVPNMFGNAIDLIPLDVDLWASFSQETEGAPSEVTFEAGSVYDVAEWFWDFGDGDSAQTAVSQHTYDTSGYYDITLGVVTATGDTLTRVYPGGVIVLGDTLQAEVSVVDLSGLFPLIEVTVKCRNNRPLDRIDIPVEYDGELNLVFESFAVDGCRAQDFEDVSLSDDNASQKRLTLTLRPRSSGAPLYLSPGSGPLVRLYFYLTGGTAGATNVTLDGYGSPHEPQFESAAGAYRPDTKGVVVSLSCCTDRVGDANDSGEDEPTIGDVSALIDAKFITGVCDGIIVCYTEADVNQSGGTAPTCDDITIGDVTGLIDYLFISGSELGLPSCL